MKKLHLLLVLLLALGIACALAEDTPTTYESGDYTYILLADGSAEIMRYLGTQPHVTLPATLDGRPVVALDFAVFWNHYTLKSVTIPDSIVHFNASPFLICPALETIHVSASHPTLSVMDGVLFDKQGEQLIHYPGALSGTYTIPHGTKVIGDHAFSHNDKLSAINIPETVALIGNNAFINCASLTTVYIPGSVVAVGNAAFLGCDALASVIIGEGVEIIGSETFSECYALASVVLPASVSAIDGWAFIYSWPTLIVPRSSYAEYYVKNMSNLPYIIGN